MSCRRVLILALISIDNINTGRRCTNFLWKPLYLSLGATTATVIQCVHTLDRPSTVASNAKLLSKQNVIIEDIGWLKKLHETDRKVSST